MAKKRLADLLRQEAQKFSESDVAPPPEATADENLDPDAETIQEIPNPMATNPHTRRATQTKADLEATIKELRAALEQAHQKETTLQEEITQLQSASQADGEAAIRELKAALEDAHQKEADLHERVTELQTSLHAQKTFVEKLQEQLQRTSQMKTELENAKKAALQLAQTNTQLMQELEALRKEKESPKVQVDKTPDRGYKALDRGYKFIERSSERFTQQPAEAPADFARNTWLL